MVSCDQPEATERDARPGFPDWSLSDLAPDGVYRAPLVTHRPVGSYPTFSPLPLPPLRRAERRSVFCCTFP